LPEPVLTSLRALGHTLKATPQIADAPSIVRAEDGRWTGAAEPRNRGGLALGL
jgi:gamma-glutamyltranspeptidase